MEEDCIDVKDIKIEFDHVSLPYASPTNRYDSEPPQDSCPTEYEHVSKQQISSSDLSSLKATVDHVKSIKREREEDFNVPDEEQDCRSARDSLSVSRKKRQLGMLSYFI